MSRFDPNSNLGSPTHGFDIAISENRASIEVDDGEEGGGWNLARPTSTAGYCSFVSDRCDGLDRHFPSDAICSDGAFFERRLRLMAGLRAALFLSMTVRFRSDFGTC